ncbi:S8 family peptidase [Rubrivivax gelatinosus]|uniref:S8 family peptidase n=1 Tax=Rubrivivax gelatinosus TaxID=28068 RepID=UPI003A800443
MIRLVKRAGRLALLAAAAAVVCAQPAVAGGSDLAVLDAEALAQRSQWTDQLIVKYRKGTAGFARADAQALAKANEVVDRAGLQMRLLRRDARHAAVMKLDQRVTVTRLREIARAVAAADSDIEYVEPDRLLQPMATPNDTRYVDQWHYYESTGGLNLPGAWDTSTGSGVVVAVLDTGYRPHADLAANVVGGYDMIKDTAVSNDGDARDSDAKDPGDWTTAGECYTGSAASSSSWHGTHVAGTIAAVTNNASGVAGVAYGAKILPVRVLGKCGGYTSDIADAITWASGGSVSGAPTNAYPARVVSLSLGGSGSCDTTTQTAIDGARSRGTVVVVAAGNSNANAANYSPASCSGVITVAAVNRSGGRAYYSNYGSVVDIAAPGGDMRSASANGILSTLNSGSTTPGSDSYAYYQGTLMATPHVSGAVALMLARNSALTPDQVESLLKSSARAFPATCSQCGSGIVDAAAAVVAAVGGSTGGGTTTVAEVESNNTRSTAQSVTANPAQVNGSIASSSDTDYYKVTLAAGKTLSAKLTPPASYDFDLYLYSSSGATLARSTLGTGQVDTVTYANTGSSALTLYVRVLRYSGTGSYTLGLTQ